MEVKVVYCSLFSARASPHVHLHCPTKGTKTQAKFKFVINNDFNSQVLVGCLGLVIYYSQFSARASPHDHLHCPTKGTKHKLNVKFVINNDFNSQVQSHFLWRNWNIGGDIFVFLFYAPSSVSANNKHKNGFHNQISQ